MSKNRFQITHQEQMPRTMGTLMDNQTIFKDKVTGVLYLYTENRGGNPTTIALLDTDGKPLIDK